MLQLSDKAMEIFDRMISMGEIPNEVTLTALLSMWGSSKRPDAGARIVRLFQITRAAGQPLGVVAYR
jgi:hypothetical protein